VRENGSEREEASIMQHRLLVGIVMPSGVSDVWFAKDIQEFGWQEHLRWRMKQGVFHLVGCEQRILKIPVICRLLGYMSSSRFEKSFKS
jgi:hypothetical protein